MFICRYLGAIGNIVLEIDVCSWQSNVENALRTKIADDAEEMGAFMKHGYEFYLTGNDYNGYDGITIDNLTVISFALATPSPTGTGNVDISSTLAPSIDTTKTPKKSEEFYEEYLGYWVYAAIAAGLICCYIIAIIYYCCRNQSKIKKV